MDKAVTTTVILVAINSTYLYETYNMSVMLLS